jgi:hypothetical protein
MTKPEYTDEDMANVGRALMDRLPDGYSYMNCPSEIVTDLQNEITDLRTEVREAFDKGYCAAGGTITPIISPST